MRISGEAGSLTEKVLHADMEDLREGLLLGIGWVRSPHDDAGQASLVHPALARYEILPSAIFQDGQLESIFHGRGEPLVEAGSSSPTPQLRHFFERNRRITFCFQ